MELTESKAGKVVIVTPLEKRLDASAATDFKQKMLAITSRGEQHILVDLSNVDFIDSSGLGAFISVLKKLVGLILIDDYQLNTSVIYLHILSHMKAVIIFHHQMINTLMSEIKYVNILKN